MMKTQLILLFLLYNCNLFAQLNDVYFVQDPSLSPDASSVLFSYEGDLWKANTADGISQRLTAMSGNETRAKYSPDGKWIAFSSTQYGNADLYIMSVNGGDIKQLTYSDGADLMESWSWDSQKIYFQNTVENGGTAYEVSISGGTPKRLFNHFFNRIHNVVASPNGDIYFNDTWESANQAYRKRYKGPYNPDIQSYNFATQKYKQHTNYEGKDMWPSIDKKGTIYFVSDEFTGQYNLFSLKDGKKIALTKYDEPIKSPSVSANGMKVVFKKGYRLWLYDVATNKANALALKVHRNATFAKDKDYDVKGNISHFDVSPDGKKMVFASRGVLFVSDVKGKYVKQLSKSNLERITECKWINNDSILYSQTYNGYQNLFLTKGNGDMVAKQLTFDEKTNRQLSINKSKTKAIFLSGRDELKILDLKKLSVETLVKDEFWAIQSDVPQFSPNEEYVMYQAVRDFEKEIFLAKISDKSITQITNSGVSETSAIWSADGEAIYFITNRLKPFYPFGNDEGHVYKLPLSIKDKPLRSTKFDELWKQNAPTKDSTKSKEIKPLDINLDMIMERMQLVGPDFGTQNQLFLTKKDNKTTIFFMSDHSEGKSALWKLEEEPFETNKTTKVADISGYTPIEVGGKIYMLNSGNISTLNSDFSKLEAIDIKYTFRKNYEDEFHQMFEELWAGVGENFYNETYHGTNWKRLKSTFQKYLPYVNTRSDFREMVQDMLGELNASHTGINTSGPEETLFHKNTTMHTGILYDVENPYKVKSIVKRSPAYSLINTIKSGHTLTAVNGVAIDPKGNRDQYFANPSLDEEVALTFKNDTGSYTVNLSTISSSQWQDCLYGEWMDENQAKVGALSKNQIAYVHMKDMGGDEYERFVIDMTQDFYNKKAVIVDLRYNRGGNVHDKVLNFLAQKPYLKWKYREGKFTQQPNFAPAGKPIILLINEQSLSDAEMTAEGFKTLGLGKIIGIGTYRWIIFTSAKGLVDGSSYRLPSWGCYSLDGTRNLEQTGVSPDIEVDLNFYDKQINRDPQIERAVQEIMKMW